MDSGELQIEVKMPAGTSFQQTGLVMNRIDSLLRADVPEALAIYTSFGEKEGIQAIIGSGPHLGTIRIRLAPLAERKRSSAMISNAIEAKLSGIPDADVVIYSGGVMGDMMGGSMVGRLTGSSGEIAVEIAGYDLQASEKIAKQIQGLIATIPGTKNAKVSLQAGYPELQVQVDREKAGS